MQIADSFFSIFRLILETLLIYKKDVENIFGDVLGEDEVRDGGEEGAGPAEGGDDGGPLDVGHGEDVERGADGQVALQRERQDRQHRGVRGAAI